MAIRPATEQLRAEGRALARAALAGNPSDGYGGATLAVTIPTMRAVVTVDPDGRNVAAGGTAATADGSGGCEAHTPLITATVRRFDRHAAVSSDGLRLAWQTTIPRSVGLGGSSAIVIATLRALSAHHGIALPEAELAALALAVETDDLGIVAGLQDRVAQAFGGLTFMEFDPARGGPRYEPLNPGLLPPLAIAYRIDTDEHSGIVHDALRRRHDAGEPAVRTAMAALGQAARDARDALLARDHEGFAAAVDRTFDLRASILSLDPRHVAMVSRARTAGAGANYTGSGGAIVGVCRDEAHRAEVLDALRAVRCSAVAAPPPLPPHIAI
jgi:glucuronokinase